VLCGRKHRFVVHVFISLYIPVLVVLSVCYLRVVNASSGECACFIFGLSLMNILIDLFPFYHNTLVLLIRVRVVSFWFVSNQCFA
jgi:hypothetical protein